MKVMQGVTGARSGGRVAGVLTGLTGLMVSVLVTVIPAAAAANGSWTVTGTMTSARTLATATLLRSGKVLVAGGQSLASAELYDPATGTWAATGSMPTARAGQTATLLASGKVLVAGPDATADLYDPATGTWSATGPMAGATGAGATATLLPDGTVLVAGGCCTHQLNGLSLGLAAAQIYHPASNSWLATASMSTGRDYATATLLGNGTVLVAGGRTVVNLGEGSVASAEIYDPATGLWHTAGTMTAGHALATASLLPDGQVLVAGGAVDGCCGGITGADLYNPATGTWHAAANMNVAREEAASAVLPDGSVLMTGGYNGITPTPYLASAEIYQPAANTWTPAPTMTQRRENQTATELPDGQVLVAGGDADGRPLGTAELYNPGTTPGNLIPDPGFETPAVPSDYRHSKLARSSAIAHTGSWSLAQTTRSRRGSWNLDSSPAWYAPISPGPTYTASIWVQSTKRVTVTLNIDLLDTAGHQVSSISSPKTTLTASTWTELTITGIKPANRETYAAMAPQFSNATHGTIIYWDDMSLTNP